MSSATQSIGYFISRRPTEADQQKLDQLDEILPELSQEEIWESVFEIADAFSASVVVESQNYQKVRQLGEQLEADSSNIALLKALVSRLEAR